MPTLTPLASVIPTLSADRAEALVLDLSLNNQGCRLPCWWGTQPGQTSWETVERFLSTFALAIKPRGLVEPALYTAYFAFPKEIDPNPNDEPMIAIEHNYTVANGVVEQIEVNPGLAPNYGLSAILSAYGRPEEIRLRTYKQSREGDLPFDVVLYYPKLGILIRYATQGVIAAHHIRGCPQERPAAVIALWSPESGLSFADAARQTIDIRDEAEWAYRPVQEVTDMTIDTFWKAHQHIDATACLETPSDIWPPP